MRVVETDDGVIVEIESEAETEQLGCALAAAAPDNTVIGLIGPLGAGKTRLVRALAEALGVPAGSVTSPTFVLIHEYEGARPVFHFDTYRLRDASEFEALGAADYWRRGGVCLVEWADRVIEFLPADSWMITIEPTGPASRRFVLRLPTARVSALLDSLLEQTGRTAQATSAEAYVAPPSVAVPHKERGESEAPPS